MNITYRQIFAKTIPKDHSGQHFKQTSSYSTHQTRAICSLGYEPMFTQQREIKSEAFKKVIQIFCPLLTLTILTYFNKLFHQSQRKQLLIELHNSPSVHMTLFTLHMATNITLKIIPLHCIHFISTDSFFPSF